MPNLQFSLVIAQLGSAITSLIKELISEIKKSKCIENENDIATFADNINNFFVNDPIYQNVYKKCEQGFYMDVLNTDESLVYSVMRYLNFFRQIYYYSDNMAFFKYVDIYLRYPFFFVVNNPIIQENIIFANVDKLEFLFDFYEMWSSKIKYDELKSDKYIDIFGNRQLLVEIEKEYKFLPLQEFDLIDRYIAFQFISNHEDGFCFKRILKDGKAHEFKLSKINDPNSIYIKTILNMNNPKDKSSWINDAKYYLKSTQNEIEYAAQYEHLWIIEEQNSKTAAVAVFIANPKDEPKDNEGNYIFNFSRECLSFLLEDDDFSVFDSVIVNNSYQGLGFQRLLLMLAKETAKKHDKKCIFATVSQFNSYSYKNLELSGYARYQDISYTVINDEGDSVEYPRYLMRLNII